MTHCSGCNSPIRNHVWPIGQYVYCSLGCWRYTTGDIFIDKNVKEEKGGIYGAMTYKHGGRAAGDSGSFAKRRKG